MFNIVFYRAIPFDYVLEGNIVETVENIFVYEKEDKKPIEDKKRNDRKMIITFGIALNNDRLSNDFMHFFDKLMKTDRNFIDKILDRIFMECLDSALKVIEKENDEIWVLLKFYVEKYGKTNLAKSLLSNISYYFFVLPDSDSTAKIIYKIDDFPSCFAVAFHNFDSASQCKSRNQIFYHNEKFSTDLSFQNMLKKFLITTIIYYLRVIFFIESI